MRHFMQINLTEEHISWEKELYKNLISKTVENGIIATLETKSVSYKNIYTQNL